MRPSFRVLAISAICLQGSAAFADAIVQPLTGGVLISRGQGFRRVTSTASLKTGDRVTVTQGNAATVAYPDGCKIDVRPGAVYIVAPVSPCAVGQVPDDTRERCRRATTDEERNRLRCPAGLFGDLGPELAVTGLIIGGAAAALALTGDDNKNNPSAPMSP